MKKLLLASLTLLLALVSCTDDNQVKDLSTQEAFDEYKSSYTSYQLAETNFFEPEASFRQSSLYRMCQAMPKGADLHVHCDAMLPIVEQGLWHVALYWRRYALSRRLQDHGRCIEKRMHAR